MAAPAPSKLDGMQTLQGAFVDDEGAFRVVGSITAQAPPTGITDVIMNRTNDSVGIGTYGPSGADFTGTSVSSKFALDVFQVNSVGLTGSVSGVFQPTGLQTGLSTSAVIIGDTPTPIPMTMLDERNGISIRVWLPSSAVVFVGNSAVTIDNGYPKLWLEEIQMDARNATGTTIYGVCASGATAELRVMQIA